ncbi:MAG: molecular chaperone DnaJ [Streptosporangiaceae bacterium]
MQRPGEQRRRGRQDPRAAQALAAALAAKEAAAQAFYDLDQAQKYVRGRISLLADLDAAAAGRFRPGFDRLDARADEVASGYITVVDSHDLDDTGRTFAEYDAAHRALLGVTDTLARLTREINQIAANVATELSRLESSLDQLPPRLRAAQTAMAQAILAVEQAKAAGMRTEEVETDLAAVRASLDQLTSAGLGGLGLAGAMRRAEEVRTQAGQVAQEAADLAVAVQKTRNDLASVRTRVQMVAGRIDQVNHAMSELRRSYTANCWQDLQGAPAAIESALERARERIAETESQAGKQQWRACAQALAAARAELKDAERRAKAVTDRLADLEAAKADPGKPLDQTRFAVRDAQRLAVAQPGGAAPQHAQSLDALVVRLEHADSLLAGAHPDYWSYLKELRSISTSAHDVVEMIRSGAAPR